ncbi:MULTISPECIES: IclR family transcriptional regulator [unclassified Devosia]|uniref:IclR family transcriptional regulator n=1 Tax=unclassified Devosia TaxID=196773 RepID=UPI001AD0AA5A|nr:MULTISPECIES: IclR family transcriptional regulator [unclassified Devosia]MBN9304770.1 IclR family transcriptional regulator [Devosia sp.]
MDTTTADSALPRARGIDRVIDILECLKENRTPMTIGDISRKIRAPRSSTYEIVARLAEAGMLEIDNANRAFFGRAIYFYADAYLASQPLLRHGRSEVLRLAKVHGETAQLCMLVGNKYTVGFMQPGASLFRIISEIGVLVPIPWTASGRLLVGGMTPDEIHALIPDEDFRLPSGRTIDFDSFLADVERGMKANVMMTVGLSDTYTCCLAAAIRDERGHPIATLCFMIPANSEQARAQELLSHLNEAAARISSAMSRELAE